MDEETFLNYIHLSRMLAQRQWELAFPDMHGSSLTTSKLTFDCFIQKRTDGVGLYGGL